MTRLLLLAMFCAGALCAEETPDTFLLYRVGGRTWTIKSMPGAAGDQNNSIQFMRYEVLEVHEDHAMYSRLRLDQNKKPPKGVEPSIGRMEFKADRPPFKAPDGAVAGVAETLKVAGQSFECDVYTITVGNATPSKYWYSKRYPGLLVREEAMNGTDELVEFDAFKEDEPPKKEAGRGKKPPKEAPKEEAPPSGTYLPKKPWIMAVRSSAGTTYKRFEVVKGEAEQAELKVTALDENKKAAKGAKGETLVAKFGEAASPIYTGGDGVEDRVEKRKTPAGVMECRVYRAKIDGKDAHIWVAVKYPGLVVRTAIGENGKEGGSELCEFKE
ncbi:hypothetical protein BAC2_00137 [uncultured bacterium]|nr:hypothetical protein BAC2_00137 [uncultured bacterium]